MKVFPMSFAACAQGVLRTKETIDRFKSVAPTPGQTSPLLVYFGTLLTRGKLNVFESAELAQLVLSQNKKHLLDNWLKEVRPLSMQEDLSEGLLFDWHWHLKDNRSCSEDPGACVQDKLEPSEQLGDLLRRAGDNDAALAVYQKANVPGKVIEGLAAKGDFEALSKFRCGAA